MVPADDDLIDLHIGTNLDVPFDRVVRRQYQDDRRTGVSDADFRWSDRVTSVRRFMQTNHVNFGDVRDDGVVS